ncbi:hypothetical protein J7K06_05870 [Candidatus Bathyarchaeota archaeon]|nr:hypothetical protein [Candidatus Bathyarchaeota archaeon]
MTTKKSLILILALLLLSQILILLPKTLANSSLSNDLSKIKVNKIAHTVELLDGGLIVINDTITVSADENVSVNFPIGFPYDYARYLIKCRAVADNKEIPIVPDYGLGSPGFYGVLVNLTSIEDEFKINSTPKNFTVTFIFSGPIVAEDDYLTVNFTLFPSLAIDAQKCYTTVIFPDSLNLTEASFTYNKTETKENRNYYYLNPIPLEKFAYSKAKAWLRLRVSESFIYAEIEKLERKIEVDLHGNINVKDIYYIVNKGTKTIDQITIFFPKEGYDFVVESAIGTKFSDVSKEDLKSNRLHIPSIGPNEKNVFSLVYKLNSTNGKYKLNISIDKITPILIKKLVVSFISPRGISFESSSVVSMASSIERDLSKDSVTFILHNFTIVDSFQATVAYRVNIFWASYPYTLIALISSSVILLGVFARRRLGPAPVAAPKVVVSPKIFRKFVESYEERIKIMSRIERLEEQARKGRIPRRQFKVRKTMLENKLSLLSKDLAELRETIRRSGPRYADIIRQLEIAEAQLEEAEAGIRRVRSRYRRGEISREAYRRLLEEHEKRIDDANLKIEGALLRLREEYR